MFIEHLGKQPRIHPSAYVAPTAVISGDVEIGEESRILHGAVITAEGAPITIGRYCIVMQKALKLFSSIGRTEGDTVFRLQSKRAGGNSLCPIQRSLREKSVQRSKLF